MKEEDSVLKVSRHSKVGEEQAKSMINDVLTDKKKQDIEQKYNLSQKSIEGQAAIYFANGEYRHGMDALVNKLNSTKGKAEINTWYMILDGYETIGNRDSFEKLSEYFAKKFNLSAPQFHYTEEKREGQLFGRNVLIVDGPISDLQIEKAKDFLNASKESAVAKIDISRLTVKPDDKNGINILNKVLSSLRKYRVDCQLMGDLNLVETLKTLTEKYSEPKHKDLWELYLELLVWRQNEQAFEEIAMVYAEKFEVSPPGFEKLFKKKVEKKDDKRKDILVQQVVSDIYELEKDIKLMFYSQQKVILNCKNLKRITIDASEKLRDMIDMMSINRDKIIMLEPNQIMTTIFEMTNLLDKVTIIPKRR